MVGRVDLTQSEIPARVLTKDGEWVTNPEYPADLRCKSGHRAPEGTRFFSISGRVLAKELSGVYCEHCLVIANMIAKAKKKNE